MNKTHRLLIEFTPVTESLPHWAFIPETVSEICTEYLERDNDK